MSTRPRPTRSTDARGVRKVIFALHFYRRKEPANIGLLCNACRALTSPAVCTNTSGHQPSAERAK